MFDVSGWFYVPLASTASHKARWEPSWTPRAIAKNVHPQSARLIQLCQNHWISLKFPVRHCVVEDSMSVCENIKSSFFVKMLLGKAVLRNIVIFVFRYLKVRFINPTIVFIVSENLQNWMGHSMKNLSAFSYHENFCVPFRSRISCYEFTKNWDIHHCLSEAVFSHVFFWTTKSPGPKAKILVPRQKPRQSPRKPSQKPLRRSANKGRVSAQLLASACQLLGMSYFGIQI